MSNLALIHNHIAAAYEAMTTAGSTWTADEQTRQAVNDVIQALDEGSMRAVRRNGNEWESQDWVRQAILLYFRMTQADVMMGPNGATAFDKIPLKTQNWSADDFRAAGFRQVPGSIVRRGAYIGKNCVLMPSFVNIGAYVGDGTMVDTWATVGSCAQIGKHVHISGGTGIGGVLEPLQAKPVIIGDRAFIGARCEIAEGVVVGEGAVIAMGTYISASTKIFDRATGVTMTGMVPPYAVVVPGTLPSTGGASLACGVIVKTVDARTREKTGVNELLRAA